MRKNMHTLFDEEDRWALKIGIPNSTVISRWHIAIFTRAGENPTPHNARTIHIWKDTQQGDTHNTEQSRDLV